MPIYYLTCASSDFDVNVIIEAKSETAARLHVTREIKCESIGARRLAELVREKGVQVLKAGKGDEAAAEAAAAELRG